MNGVDKPKIGEAKDVSSQEELAEDATKNGPSNEQIRNMPIEPNKKKVAASLKKLAPPTSGPKPGNGNNKPSEPVIVSVGKWLGRIFFLHGEDQVPESKNKMKFFDIEEVKALYRYVVDRGVEVDPKLIEDLGLLIIKVDRPAPLSVAAKQRFDADVAKLLGCYSEVTKTTFPKYGVSGRAIRDSANYSEAAISQAGRWGLLFFVLAILPEATYSSIDETSNFIRFAEFFILLSPFFWGGVGSSIFLLKSLSEIAGRSKFDSRKLQGVPTRIFLGAALGFIVVEVFKILELLQPVALDSGVVEIQFGSSSVAFLTGIGTKAVYGVLEMLIESTATRLGRTRK